MSRSILILLTIALLRLPTSPTSSSSSKGLAIVEKTRLGSMPPSCHSKCNECHPCFAVQVPTQPSHDSFAPGLNRVRPSDPTLLDLYDLPGKRYSNYKPLGWKCRCNDHFFNP